MKEEPAARGLTPLRVVGVLAAVAVAAFLVLFVVSWARDNGTATAANHDQGHAESSGLATENEVADVGDEALLDGFPCAGVPANAPRTHYRERRYFVEVQGWLSPMPGTDKTGHDHYAMCFPFWQPVTDALELDYKWQAHDHEQNVVRDHTASVQEAPSPGFHDGQTLAQGYVSEARGLPAHLRDGPV